GAIRERIESGDGERGRAHAILRNLEILERLEGKDVDGNERAFREVTLAFERRWNVRDARDSFAHAEALVVDEEEGAAFLDGSAERESEVVADVFGRGVGWREIVGSVERGIAEELVGGSVDVIGAAAQQHVDLPARTPSEGGVISTCKNLKFAHCIDRWSN